MNDELRKAVREWLEVANEDWTAARVLLDSASPPARSVCFHCQQYVEKLLKGTRPRRRARTT